MKKTFKYIACILCLSFGLGACVDNDDVVVNYYASTKVSYTLLFFIKISLLIRKAQYTAHRSTVTLPFLLFFL